MLGVVIAEGIVARRIPWRRSPLDFLLITFIVVYFISGVLSSYRLIAIGETVLLGITIYFTFGPLYQVLQQDRDFLTPFLWAWVGGGVAAAMWGIVSHLLTKLPASTQAIGPNALGTTLLVATGLSVGLLSGTGTAWKFLVAGGIPVLVLGLTLTYSRGAGAGAAGALGVFFLLVELRHSWRAFLLLILIGIAGATFIAFAHPAIDPAVIKRIEGTTFNPNVTHWRVFVAKSALAIFRDHPLLGTGFGTFSLVYPQYRLPGDPNPPTGMPFAHNIFLNTAAEVGALGLAAFTAVIVWAMVAGWQWYARSLSSSDTIRSAAVLSAFMGMLMQQLFDGTIQSVHLGAGLWLLVAILGASRP